MEKQDTYTYFRQLYQSVFLISSEIQREREKDAINTFLFIVSTLLGQFATVCIPLCYSQNADAIALLRH